MIGSALMPFLEALGNFVTPLRRGEDFDPARGVITKAKLENYDVIMNFCGASLVTSYWTKTRMQELYSSRILSTRLLASTIPTLHKPPQLFLSASAVGFYGSRGDERLTEHSGCGSGFLANLCKDWEHEAELARTAATRVVCLRMGVVLAKHQGALAKMVPAFKWGFGAKLGSGSQWMSWIMMRDLLWLIEFIVRHEAISGAVNASAPFPVTNKEFSEKLAKALSRPCFFRIPGWFLRLLFGKMADETLLVSTRALPEKIQAAGFQFSHPELQFSRVLQR